MEKNKQIKCYCGHTTYCDCGPLEEPKQYPIGGYAPGNYMCYCVTCKTKFQGDKRASQCEPCAVAMTKEEPKTNLSRVPFPELVKELVEYYNSVPLVEEPKQETNLEEAAKRLYQEGLQNDLGLSFHDGVKFGAKWQQERRYSEEEVKHLIHLACHHSGVSVFKRFEKWFEKFKK